MKKPKNLLTLLLLFTLLSACTPKPDDTPSNIPTSEPNNNISEDTNNQEDAQNPEDENQEPDNTEEEDTPPKEVEAVFLNMPIYLNYEENSTNEGYFLQDEWPIYHDYPSEGKVNQIISLYDIADYDTTLYAFWVRYGKPEADYPDEHPQIEDYDNSADYYDDFRSYRYKVLIESMKDTNVSVVKNYPFTINAVMGMDYFIEHDSFYSGDGDYSAPVVVGTINDILEAFPEGEAVDGYYYRLLPATRADAAQVAREKGLKEPLHGNDFKRVLGTEWQVTVKVEVE